MKVFVVLCQGAEYNDEINVIGGGESEISKTGFIDIEDAKEHMCELVKGYVVGSKVTDYSYWDDSEEPAIKLLECAGITADNHNWEELPLYDSIIKDLEEQGEPVLPWLPVGLFEIIEVDVQEAVLLPEDFERAKKNALQTVKELA